MDRTKKLIMSVTASALLTGSGGIDRGLAKATAVTSNSETMKPNLDRYYNPQTAEAAKAADIISELLYGIPEQNAMSLNELLARRPDLNRGIAEKAIQNLLKSGEIRKIGDGSQYKPFRYYDRSRGGGHGG